MEIVIHVIPCLVLEIIPEVTVFEILIDFFFFSSLPVKCGVFHVHPWNREDHYQADNPGQQEHEPRLSHIGARQFLHYVVQCKHFWFGLLFFWRVVPS